MGSLHFPSKPHSPLPTTSGYLGVEVLDLCEWVCPASGSSATGSALACSWGGGRLASVSLSASPQDGLWLWFSGIRSLSSCRVELSNSGFVLSYFSSVLWISVGEADRSGRSWHSLFLSQSTWWLDGSISCVPLTHSWWQWPSSAQGLCPSCWVMPERWVGRAPCSPRCCSDHLKLNHVPSTLMAPGICDWECCLRAVSGRLMLCLWFFTFEACA